MKISSHFTYLVIGLFTLCGSIACNPTSTSSKKAEAILVSEKPDELVIQAVNFSETSEGFEISEDKQSVISSSEGKAWLDYVINIQVTGRYRVEVKARRIGKGSAGLWMEDYIENKDGRTYNITGTFAISDQSSTENFESFSKDGTPINKGIHGIRLHKEGASLSIEEITFTLIRPHEKTPQIQTQNTAGNSWKLVWSDEFEGEGLPDGSKWTYDVGDWGWGNNELQYYTVEKTENARLEGGNLIITARKNDQGHDWTSARLTTRGKVSFLYGKIEFRAKVPPNKGCWAAGWTLGDDYKDEKSWPYCGEIDILESVGYEMDDESGDGKAHASVHCHAYYFKLGNQHTADVPVKNMDKEFHTYSVVWEPTKIMAYVDDNLYFTYEDDKTEGAWPFDQPQNIILNLAMGGGWGGAQGMDETVTKQEFVIDYVKVFELE